MTKPIRTWWGEKFIAALESFTDPARLGRGRSYAGERIEDLTIGPGLVRARVRGSVNPYFGVYKAPLYTTEMRLSPLGEAQWRGLIDAVGRRAGLISRLLLNELPDALEELCRRQGLALLPAGPKDFTTRCSCPDWANPCKHVAGVCYRLAQRLDREPLLLFELRGLPRARLREALLATPLGEALAETLADDAQPAPEPVGSYHTRPVAAARAVSYAGFWQAGPLPPEPAVAPPPLPAVLIRRGGAQPPFWDRQESFIEVMTGFYERVRKANKEGL